MRNLSWCACGAAVLGLELYGCVMRVGADGHPILAPAPGGVSIWRSGTPPSPILVLPPRVKPPLAFPRRLPRQIAPHWNSGGGTRVWGDPQHGTPCVDLQPYRYDMPTIGPDMLLWRDGERILPLGNGRAAEPPKRLLTRIRDGWRRFVQPSINDARTTEAK